MQPVPITCPNCGGGLGPMEQGEYLCAYCGHRSSPPQPVLDRARQDALVAQAVAKHDAARFARERAASEERAARGSAAAQAGMRAGARSIAGVGVMCFVFALACFGGGAYILGNDIPTFVRRNVGGLDANSAPGVALFLFVMGVVNVVAGGKMFAQGRRAFGPRIFGGRRERRLLAEGLRARALVTSYRQRDLLSSDPKFDLVLRVELAGRAPYVIKKTERVSCAHVVTTGAELPIFVDPANANDVMIDWETAAAT